VTDIPIGESLSGPHHPEQKALLRLIGTLVPDPREDAAAAVNSGREWSDAELSELGDMLLGGLSMDEIAVSCAAITARSKTRWSRYAEPADKASVRCAASGGFCCPGEYNCRCRIHLDWRLTRLAGASRQAQLRATEPRPRPSSSLCPPPYRMTADGCQK
jgi:hypothetical protein